MLVERKSLRDSRWRNPLFRSLALQRLACLDLANAFRDIGDRLAAVEARHEIASLLGQPGLDLLSAPGGLHISLHLIERLLSGLHDVLHFIPGIASAWQAQGFVFDPDIGLECCFDQRCDWNARLLDGL